MSDTDTISIKNFWKEVYDYNFTDIADWLNEFFPIEDGNWNSSQHGERLYLTKIDHETGEEYVRTETNRIDLWRQEVSYYFDAYMDIIKNENDKVKVVDDEERITQLAQDIFVFHVLRIFLSKLLEDLSASPPKDSDNYMFL